ncbi:MAG: SMP-30/gluconolactonase/LRE family protein [Bacteroidota bacterium]
MYRLNALLLIKTDGQLSESPYWLDELNCFLWVDIERKHLGIYHWLTKKKEIVSIPYRLSMIVTSWNGDVILGLQGGLAKFDIATKELIWLLDIEKEHYTQRCNDGKCDNQGRLWIGTMDITCKAGAGSLYCVDTDLKLSKKADQLTIPNGIEWSLDYQKLYHIDSITRCVTSYLFNEDNAGISNKERVIEIPEDMGLPDGMTRDENGMLWIANHGGFSVCCWNPVNGQLLAKIEVPVPLVTSCVFGGIDLEYLIITTARQGLSKEEINKYPLSGSVFVAKPGIKGIPANKFGKQIKYANAKK